CTYLRRWLRFDPPPRQTGKWVVARITSRECAQKTIEIILRLIAQHAYRLVHRPDRAPPDQVRELQPALLDEGSNTGIGALQRPRKIVMQRTGVGCGKRHLSHDIERVELVRGCMGERAQHRLRNV